MLPPDMDSNQTLTASCRADVWAGATLETAGHRVRERWWRGGEGEITAHQMRHMGKKDSKNTKETQRE